MKKLGLIILFGLIFLVVTVYGYKKIEGFIEGHGGWRTWGWRTWKMGWSR